MQSASNWGERPLSRDLLDYAAGDVEYLLELQEILQASLEQDPKKLVCIYTYD